MKRLDHPKSKQYQDIFPRTYYVSNEHSEQTEKFSNILKDKFVSKSSGLFLGVTGGIDPFMNFAVNSNCNSFIGIDINPIAIELMEARINLAVKSVTGESYLQDLFAGNLEELNILITEELSVIKKVLLNNKNQVLQAFKDKEIALSGKLVEVIDLYFSGDVKFIKHMMNVYKSSLNSNFGWLNQENFTLVKNNILSNLVIGQSSLTDIFDYPPIHGGEYLKVLYISNVHHYLDKATRQSFANNLLNLEKTQNELIYILADGADDLLSTGQLESWLLKQEYRDSSGAVIL